MNARRTKEIEMLYWPLSLMFNSVFAHISGCTRNTEVCPTALQELQMARLEVGKVQEMLTPPEPEEEPQEEVAEASAEQVSRICWAAWLTQGQTPGRVGMHNA